MKCTYKHLVVATKFAALKCGLPEGVGVANPLKLMCVHKQGARGLELNFGNLSSCHIDIDEVLVPPN